jgi:hypothetical protein
MLRTAGLFCFVLFAACAGPGAGTRSDASSAEPVTPVVPEEPVAPEPTLFLPDDWSTSAPWDFERAVGQLEPGFWSQADRTTLGIALKRPEQVSIRAAVLLAYGGIDSAHVILANLEERIEESAREGDAAEVVAARALIRFPDERIRERLRLLAVGGVPHPDLEIRTECACVALMLGEREVIPFLLRVLHAGTPAQRNDPIDWSEKQTLAWSKGRAAASLSLAAGVPNEFQADGPWASQNAQADALENALGFGKNQGRGPSKGN